MTRLLLHVEGQTEEDFVKEVLAPHLYAVDYTVVSARLIGNARQRNRRGGIKPWPTVRRDILNHLRRDPGCLVSTMVDYYGLPQSGADAWPGRIAAARSEFPEKASTVEDALLADVCEQMGSDFNPDRFVPYVMMHEFEAMLFSDCELFSNGVGRRDLVSQFQAIRDAFESPEEIDDSPLTAPSKRIMALFPGYQKPLMGTLGVLSIGLNAILRECPHFRSWLERLESGRPTGTSLMTATPC
jgi:hypothetical protein